MTDKSADALDWISETPKSIEARLAGAKQIQDQLRFVLGVMAIISMMILIASYNAYLSYDYAWAVKQAKEHMFAPQRTVADILTEQGLRSWADSRTVTISLVGIRVNVDDAPVLGTLSLLVASVWLLLLARRENKTIGLLLQDTDSRLVSDNDQAESSRGQDRWLIFHTIVSNSPFINLDRSLTRISSLRTSTPARSGIAVNRFEGGMSRALGAFFFLFPPLVCLVMFVPDRTSYSRPSPFMPDAAAPGLPEFYWSSFFVFFLCWIPLLICCWRARRYVTATESVLREYRDALFADSIEAARRSRAGQPADLRSPPTPHA